MLLVRFAACLLVIAAHSAFSAATFTVSGVVVNSLTGEPIPHALVQSTGAEHHMVLSGQDGRFEMQGVPPGNLFFVAQKPGFMSLERYAPTKVGSGTPLITVKLAPESSIEGRIVDSDGEAIEGLSISCMMQAIMNGRKRWQMCGSAQTDETGNYGIQSLRPGSYILRTNAQALFAHVQNADDTLPQQAYPPHLYPDAADLSSAQPIIVRAGETERADFSIAPVRAFYISGRATPAQSGIYGWVQSPEGDQQPANIGIDSRTGTWRSAPVPAGAWNIVLQSGRGREADYYAAQAVNVTSADVKNIQMALEPLPPIPVNVNSPAPPEQRQIQIQLMPDIPSPFGPPMFDSNRSPRNVNEIPMVRNVHPGTYTVFAMTYGGYCLSSISAGGVDLTRNSLVVSAGSQTAPIDVTLEDNCGSIQGQVRTDHPAANASVILVPSSRAIQPQLLPLPEDGSFAFANLSPGDYRLYAVSTADGLEYGNPEAMRQIDGTSITLAAKQKANATLNLVTRDAD